MQTCMRRRKIILAAGFACIGGSAQPAHAAEEVAALPLVGENVKLDRELIDRAMAFLSRRYAHGEQVFAFPVSRLQREFRLGYRKACALAEALHATGSWRLRTRPNGTRYARILR